MASAAATISLEKLLGAAPTKIIQLSDSDIGAPIASGSHPSDGMIVLPCSMGTLAAIALGLANSLIARAADVTLKERRPLMLCVRETPFNRIHLRNMTLAAEAGATIFPCIPAFYNQPAGTEEMARQFAYRVLGHIGLPQPGAYRLEARRLAALHRNSPGNCPLTMGRLDGSAARSSESALRPRPCLDRITMG